MAVTFDTLKFVQTLESAGVARDQAAAIAAAVRDSHDAADTATKGDLRELELRLLNTLTLRTGAMAAAVVGILLAVLPLLIAK